MDLSFSDLNFNSVETLPGFEARAAFTVNSASVFKEDVDMVPTIVDDTFSYRHLKMALVRVKRCLFDCPPLQS